MLKKNFFYSLISILLIIGLSIFWFAYESIKDLDEFEKSKKLEIDLKNKRKAYMDNIASISLFGIHFRDNVRDYVGDTYRLDEDGLYIGRKIIADIPHINQFNIEIHPSNKNDYFMEYYAYYYPYSYEIFKIVGVLPKKFSDFYDESLKYKNSLGTLTISSISDYEKDKAFTKCKKYLEPFIGVIDDGIKAKTNLLADDLEFTEIHKNKKGFTILYKMNSGLNEGWDFDGFPERYFKLKSKISKWVNNKDHKESIIRLEGMCEQHYKDKNVYIALSQDIFRGYMITDMADFFYQKTYQNKIKKEKELLEFKKKKMDKSGLQ